MTETLIKIENLHKSFGKNEVLRESISKLKKGKLWSLSDLLVAGKSTLLRSIISSKKLLKEKLSLKVLTFG